MKPLCLIACALAVLAAPLGADHLEKVPEDEGPRGRAAGERHPEHSQRA